jgi:outer membrane protein
MKNTISFVLIAILTALVIWLFYDAKKYSHLAYVENQVVFNEYNGKKELETDLTKLRERHKVVLDSLVGEIGTVTAEPTEEQAKKIRMYKEVEGRFSETEAEKSQQYTSRIWNQINQAIKEYGDAHNYDFILGAQGNGNLMYSKENKNVTKEIIEYANGKYEGK